LFDPSEARQAAKQSLQEKIDMITMGGAAAGSGAEVMDTKTGAQQLGIDSKDLGEGSTFAAQKDPFAALGSNKRLVEALNSEQQDRLKRVDSAASAQGIVRKPKGEGDA
jgi:hypothetical protein